MSQPSPTLGHAYAKPAVERFLSLDVLRGLTVCFMIIVNTPGSWDVMYSPLAHADWDGFTPTDLVFPTFLFVVGNAMAFVFPKYEGMNRGPVLRRVLKRSVLIFLLGFLMYWFPFVQHTDEGWRLSPFSDTRIMGVLQRIAVCYLLASVLVLFLSRRGLAIASVLILLGYWALLTAFGDLTLEGNAVLKLDRWLMGERHMYNGEGIPFDPEGWLSTLPSVVNVLAGYLAGVWIRTKGKSYETVTLLLIAGFASLTTAYFWDLLFPINKKLWTSSYAVYTIGLDLVLLGVLVFVIELKGRRGGWYFFEVFGRNPLFIYLLSQLLATLLWVIPVGGQALYSGLYERVFDAMAPGKLGSFLFALSFMLICWLVGYGMDKKKVYVRV